MTKLSDPQLDRKELEKLFEDHDVIDTRHEYLHSEDKARLIKAIRAYYKKQIEEAETEAGARAIRMVGRDMGWEESTEHYLEVWVESRIKTPTKRSS